jgi:hypothetical protein
MTGMVRIEKSVETVIIIEAYSAFLSNILDIISVDEAVGQAVAIILATRSEVKISFSAPIKINTTSITAGTTISLKKETINILTFLRAILIFVLAR